jgi:hypothetical protein
MIYIAEKKQTGSLVTRNLTDLVKKEHFILDSEYLTTVLGQHYTLHFISDHFLVVHLSTLSIFYRVSFDLKSSIVDPGCLFRIQDPGSDFFPCRISDPGLTRSRIRICIKELTPNSKKMPGMFIPNPYPGSGFFPMPDPDLGSRSQTSTGSLICKARILDI